MTITQLEYFVAVAEKLNFTRVAENSYISQTAVTQQIKALEEQLGFVLFERDKRRIKLTPAGEIYLKEVRTVLTRLNEAEKRARQVSMGYRGSLKIGFLQGIENLGIPMIIQDFIEQYPEVSIDFHSNNSGVLLTQLQEKKLDAAFTFKPSTRNYTDISFDPYRIVPLYVILHKNHHYAYKTVLTRSELVAETIIVIEAAKDEILFGFHISGFEPQNIIYVDGINSLLMMITSNIGIAILPEYNVMSVQNLDYISKIPLVNDKECFQINLAYSTHGDNSCVNDFKLIVEKYQ